MKLKITLLLFTVLTLSDLYGNIVIVNRTGDDSSIGTLRNAIETVAVDNDTILIDVSGEIVLSSEIVFPALSNITIIGPYPKHLRITTTAAFSGSSMLNIQNVSGLIIENIGFVGGPHRAMYIDNNTNVQVKDCLFENLSSGGEGGAIIAIDTDLSLTNCSFIGNQGIEGGAVYTNGGVLISVNCSYIGNLGDSGGVFYGITGTLYKLLNNTFKDNSTASANGEVLVADACSVELQNSAGAGNGSAMQFSGTGGTSFVSYGGNVIKTNLAETVPFADAGDIFSGSLAVGLRGSVLEDGFGLKYLPIRFATSQYIDNGTTGGLFGSLQKDGRRAPRILNNIPDAGACEYTSLIVKNTSTSAATINSLPNVISLVIGSMNYIEFDITSGSPPFEFDHALNFVINQQVFIDGYTQFGSAISGPQFEGTNGVIPAILPIEVHGSAAGTAFILNGDNSSLMGIRINQANLTGIVLNVDNIELYGNEIGLEPDGSENGCLSEGILVSGRFNKIGGFEHYQRNVISGNGESGSGQSQINLTIGSQGNLLFGNFIGTHPSGLSPALAFSNASGILDLSGDGNFIGSDAHPFGGNLIGGLNTGIMLNSSSNNIIVNNKIGIDYEGLSDISNTIGVSLLGGVSDVNIGAPSVFGRNYISGNIDANVEIGDASTVSISNNFIGPKIDGLHSGVISVAGINIFDNAANEVMIGTLDAGFENVISGNQIGINISNVGVNSVIQNNIIGLNPTGLIALPNQEIGIKLFGINNLVKIGSPGFGNIISGNNAGLGIGIEIVNSSQTTIKFNQIGLDELGLGDMTIGNIKGIKIDNSTDVVVGGSIASSEGNYISNNSNLGIEVIGSSANNYIQGNFIGLSGDGTSDRGNTLMGIHVGLADATVIGGTSDEGNFIAGSDDPGSFGIFLDDSGTGTTIKSNKIGTDISSTIPIGNHIGINIVDDHNVDIGGNGAEVNYITSSISDGIRNESTNTAIFSNFIGIGVSGFFTGCGNEIGIHNFANGIPIGGAGYDVNVIYNTSHGIFLDGAGASNTIINGCIIGTNIAFTLNQANGGNGIFIQDADNVQIGNIAKNTIAANSENGIRITDNADYTIIGAGIIGSVNASVDGNGMNGIHISNGSDSTQIGYFATNTSAQTITKNGSGAGILIEDSENTMIYGAFIGIDPGPGFPAFPNADGIIVKNSDNTRIGESTVTNRRCVIANNTNYGILLDGSDSSLIQNNVIGLDVTLNGPGANDVGIGIVNGSTGNLIGSFNDASKKNTISGNALAGIRVEADGNTISFNDIGTYGGGLVGFGNQQYGIIVTNAGSGSVIGGNLATERNIISGNDSAGVFIDNAANVEVIGNIIGNTLSPNHFYGVLISGTSATSCKIGYAPSDDFGNVILSSSSAGIYIANAAGSNQIASNRIGIDLGDAPGATVQLKGVYIHTNAGSLNEIGLASSDGGNTISGNAVGVEISGASNNFVYNNKIGVNKSGTVSIPNENGLILSNGANFNSVGETTAIQRNVISGNTQNGVVITGPTTQNNFIRGNIIGLDFAETGPLSNGIGVYINDGANNNHIGDVIDGQGNVISGNNVGIYIDGANNNFVKKNRVGPINGNNHGIVIANFSSNNIVGGGYAERNVISNNDSVGVAILSSSSNFILGNHIGINLSGTLPSPNLIGVYISGGSSNAIGKPLLQNGNVISGNLETGIIVENTPSSACLIQNNLIGTDTLGNSTVLAFGNLNGVYLRNSSDVKIGGEKALNEGNIISNNSSYGIALDNADINFIEGNNIGINLNEDEYAGNGNAGIYLLNGSDNNTIGSLTPGFVNSISANQIGILNVNSSNNMVYRNFISNNAAGTSAALSGSNVQVNGIILDTGSVTCIVRENVIGGVAIGTGILIRHGSSSNNGVYGNHIGVDASSNNILPQFIGVDIEDLATDNIIGTSGLANQNIISGNSNVQIRMTNANATSIVNNIIGTNDDGTIAHGGNYGIYDQNSTNLGIGGPLLDEENYISDMTNEGILIENSSIFNIKSNKIGIRIDATAGGNGGNGISLDNAEYGIIGGFDPEDDNEIKNNLGSGISVYNGASYNLIYRNSIYNNSGQGIDLGNNGTVLPIDGGLTPGGDNQEMDMPQILSAFACDDAGNTQIGMVVSGLSPGSSVRLQVYSNSALVDSHGEGENYITAHDYFTSSSPDTVYFDLGTSLLPGTYLSATLSHDYSTSEFSENYLVTDAPTDVIDNVISETCFGASDGYAFVDAPEGYYFTVESGGTLIGTSLATDTLFNLSPAAYDVSLYYANGCISTGNITINTGPFLDFAYIVENDTCGLNTGDISVTSVIGSAGPYSYSYSSGVDFGASPDSLNIAGGTYIVVVMDNIKGCLSENTDIIVPVIDDLVDESFSYPSDFCEGNTVLPDPGFLSGGIFDIISGAGTPSIIPSTGEISAGTILPETYEIVYTVGICNEKDTVFITANPIESASLSVTDYCAENALSISVTGATGGTFDFNPNLFDGASIDPSTGLIYNPVPGTDYAIIYTSPGFCYAEVLDTVNVFSREVAPEITALDTVFCNLMAVAPILSASGISLDWYLNETSAVYFTGIEFTPTSLLEGQNTIFAATTDLNGCRSEFDSVNYYLFNNSNFSISPLQEVCLGYSVELLASGGTTYSWDSSPYLSDTAIANPLVEGLVNDTYFFVYIENADGCSTKDSVLVKIKDVADCNIEIYNAFSPNNDGVNDYWIVDGIEAFPNNIIYIYNRWGDLINKIENYNNQTNPWDGSNKSGEIVASGTYYYVIEVYGAKSSSGWIEILK